MWKNNVERGRSHDNMAHAHCMLDTYGYKLTHSGCVILIAFPLQQCLHEHASVLHYTYIACLVYLRMSSGVSCTVLWAPCCGVQPSLPLRKECYKMSITNCILENSLYRSERDVWKCVLQTYIVTDWMSWPYFVHFRPVNFDCLFCDLNWQRQNTKFQWMAVHHSHCGCLIVIQLSFCSHI